MSSRWFLALFLVLLLSSIAFSQKLINGFTREFAIQGLPTGFSLKSFAVTGDSVSELFVLTASQLQVFDGKTFSMIFKDSAAPGTENLSPADVNRDGNMDLVASVSDTAVAVWFGSDFLNRRVFDVDSGFISFAVRNRDDGQVEFSFGFQYIYYAPVLCLNYTDSSADFEGYVLQYIDTSLTFSDSIQFNGTPSLLKVENATGYTSKSVSFIDWDYYYRPCVPSMQIQRIILGYLNPMHTTVGSVDFSQIPDGPCPFPHTLVAQSMANIDADLGGEFVAFAVQPSYPCWTPATWDLRAYDMLTSTLQWRRTDSLSITSLFTVDLNEDSIQELVSYEIQNSNPGLTEYRTSDGATLGFTELPFTPATLLMDKFGQPPAPRVLLGHGDSLVVYRIGCAANKGDMNADGNVTVFDVTLELNCAFLKEGDCNLCFADVNCDGILSAVDVVLELLAVFLQRPFPCS